MSVSWKMTQRAVTEAVEDRRCTWLPLIRYQNPLLHTHRTKHPVSRVDGTSFSTSFWCTIRVDKKKKRGKEERERKTYHRQPTPACRPSRTAARTLHKPPSFSLTRVPLKIITEVDRRIRVSLPQSAAHEANGWTTMNNETRTAHTTTRLTLAWIRSGCFASATRKGDGDGGDDGGESAMIIPRRTIKVRFAFKALRFKRNERTQAILDPKTGRNAIMPIKKDCYHVWASSVWSLSIRK